MCIFGPSLLRRGSFPCSFGPVTASVALASSHQLSIHRHWCTLHQDLWSFMIFPTIEQRLLIPTEKIEDWWMNEGMNEWMSEELVSPSQTWMKWFVNSRRKTAYVSVLGRLLSVPRLYFMGRMNYKRRGTGTMGITSLVVSRGHGDECWQDV